MNAKFCAHCGRTFEVIQVQSEERRKEIPLLEDGDEQEEPK